MAAETHFQQNVTLTLFGSLISITRIHPYFWNRKFEIKALYAVETLSHGILLF